MRDIRCMIRRHRWESRHNPEVEGPKGDYQTCVNRPGMSGDSDPWEGWSHVREHQQAVPA